MMVTVRTTARVAGAVVAALLLFPAIALCAEGGQAEQGSWLSWMFYVINFALFIAIVVRYARAPISEYFKQRAADITATIKRLEDNFRSCEQLAITARRQLEELPGEKSTLFEQMRAETELEIQRIVDTGRSVAARIRSDGELTARAAGEAAQRQLRARLASHSARLAKAIIENNFGASDQERLIDSFMERLQSEARA